MDLALIFLLLAILIFINGFFALSEMAIVSVNKNKLKLMIDEGNHGAKQVMELATESQRFLSTIQVGITLAGFFSSASAAKYLADDFGKLIALSGINTQAADTVAFVIVTIILSLFTLVMGELVPKRLALKHPEEWAIRTYKPVKFMMFLFKPFVWILSRSTNLTLRILGINPKDEEEQVSEAEIRSLIASSAESGNIEAEESEMINSVFAFNDITAQEIMTPRTEVYMVDINKPAAELVDQMIEENFSRIPVYEGSPDEIIGIIYIKDVIREARRHGFDKVDLRKIMKKPYFVPARKKINSLFRELQSTQNYIGVLVDEYGGFLGIVTIEDLIEEIVGDIFDEYDIGPDDIKEINQNSFLVSGLLLVEEVNEALAISLPLDRSYETLAGFILAYIGHIPTKREKIYIDFPDFSLQVEKMDEKRIDKVLITIKVPKSPDSDKQNS
ncbi:MAG: HlyC/CorC family transporter [Bacilli bacterium]|nr:HlyC/CorC family transporter [Bacilli bacterium]MBN2696250.1 HlyC/CorC family transporter [Bacilli bacterium]